MLAPHMWPVFGLYLCFNGKRICLDRSRTNFKIEAPVMRFGRWTFNRSRLTLTHEHRYEIDLEEMTCSAKMLDCIFQISAKGWASIDDLGQLLKALDEIFNPQATLCSFGVDHELDATAFLKRRFAEG